MNKNLIKLLIFTLLALNVLSATTGSLWNVYQSGRKLDSDGRRLFDDANRRPDDRRRSYSSTTKSTSDANSEQANGRRDDNGGWC